MEKVKQSVFYPLSHSGGCVINTSQSWRGNPCDETGEPCSEGGHFKGSCWTVGWFLNPAELHGEAGATALGWRGRDRNSREEGDAETARRRGLRQEQTEMLADRDYRGRSDCE